MRRVFLSAALVLGLMAAAPAFAQTKYPDRIVKLVSPFAPGGGTDILGRLVAQKLSTLWGSNMIVENRAGASGNLGASYVARSTPDGYTLLVAVNSHAINATVYKNIPFNLTRDFTPVAEVATSPFVLVVNSTLSVKTVPELIAYAKAHPDTVTYGSAGIATAPHLAGELFNLMAGTAMRHIPYPGSGPNVAGLLRNDVQVSAISLNSIEGLLKDGQVRVLAVTGASRYPGLPDVPTIAESGLPGYEVDLWYAILAPAGTPKDVVAKLSADLKTVIDTDEMRAALQARGYQAAYSTSDDLGALISKDLVRWREVTEKIGLKID